MEALSTLLDELVSAGGLPSASLNVRVQGQEVFHATRGLASHTPPRPAAPDQAYDLASLTKPLACSLVAAHLLAAGRLDLHAPVARHLPCAGLHPQLTAAHLLTHSSGYPAWRPLYELAGPSWGTSAARRAVLEAARTTPLEAEPGAQHRYSDLGFLVLLDLLETVGEAPFDALFHAAVTGPLGEPELRWGWPEAAATEACPRRGHVVCGTVHDLNCAAMGGISSHAGLFGTARGVARVAEAALDAHGGRGPLPSGALRALWALKGAGSHVGGWDTVSPGASSTGAHFPPDTRGHLGYTGTSMWIVPSRQTTVVFLTNRVHPVDDLSAIRAARPRVHDQIAQSLGWCS